MKSRLDLRRVLVAVLAGVLIGGGLMAVTPAGAEVGRAVATNWKKVWKQELQPLADKRYYTKKKSDKRYAKKADLGNYWTKAESDAKYQPKGNYALNGSSYTKAESDAKYAPYPALLTGAYVQQEDGSSLVIVPVSWGFRLAAAPTTHYIETGAPIPAGCSGSVEAPNADPGHFCVFESGSSNLNAGTITSPTLTPDGFRVGAMIGANASGAGDAWMRGTWALRPSGAISAAARAEGGGTNRAVADNRSLIPQ